MTAVDVKAGGLLAARRVTVRSVTEGTAEVVVDGDTGRHVVRRARGGWSCDCPAAAHRRRCSHLTAAQLVLDPALSAGTVVADPDHPGGTVERGPR